MKTITHITKPLDKDKTLVTFLAEKLALSKKKAKAMLNTRNVLVNKRRVWMAQHKLKVNDSVEIILNENTSKDKGPVRVIFDDDYYLIIDKCPGITATGPGGLEYELNQKGEFGKLLAVHRLDKDTSGCLIFAKTTEALDEIIKIFRKRHIRKIYRVIISGKLVPPLQTISEPIDNKPAESMVRTLSSSKDASHLMVNIKTGRTHQIRKHLSSVGTPVLGDRFYGTSIKLNHKKVSIGRQMLHAYSVEFEHPFTKRKVMVKAPLPHDFRKTLKLFKLT